VVVSGEEAEKKPEVSSEEAKVTKDTVVVEMETSLGMIKLELYPKKAPKTVENFLMYVNSEFFNDTIFHRVIKNFMIQGGGFTAELARKPPKAPIALESKNGLKNLKGTIAMARTRQPNSATSQFFINHKDNPNLDYPQPDGNGYAVFGKVIEGLEVVDKIADVEVKRCEMSEACPLDPIVIKSVKEIS
jgi:peptidyl-prolyl cis-trans isomerase A (cyclophilin A)